MISATKARLGFSGSSRSGIFGGSHWLRLAMLLAGSALTAAEPRPELPAKLEAVPPSAAVVETARLRQIPLEPIEPQRGTNALIPGDAVTGLVTLSQKKGRRSQWLLALQAVPPVGNELSRHPAKPMVLYSVSGKKIEFPSSRAAAVLDSFGPFVESPARRKPAKVQAQTARFLLDQDFLGLGLDRAAAASLRLGQVSLKPELWFSFQPLSESKRRQGVQLVETLKLTEDEQRALAGSCPALLSYFSTIGEIPGLEDILLRVIDMPSVWSLLWKRGVTVTIKIEAERIALADAAAWGLPAGQPVYLFPMLFELNQHPALHLTLVVTSPRPPLLTCGGIIGFLAEKPSDKETYLTLRIISARLRPTAH